MRKLLDYRLAFLGATGVALVVSLRAYAQDARALFDQPIATQSVAAQVGLGGHDEIRCSSYPDLTVREVGVDTPAPGEAAMLPGRPQSVCPTKPVASQISLKTDGFSYLGRKGPFLLFSATDPNGAIPFKVLAAATGRVVYSDGMAADRGFRNVEIENGALRLIYTRGLNAPCSIMKDATHCWAKLVGQGQIPKALANAGPLANACEASYRAIGAKADDPSVVTYDVDMTLETAGQLHVTSRGTVHCDPLP